MTIALLCPTRDRQQQLTRMGQSVIDTVSDISNVFMYIAHDEKLKVLEGAYMPQKGFLFPENLPTAQKWNLLAQEALRNPNNKLFMLAADDMIFDTGGWDKALLEHYNSLENKIHVYHFQDSRDYDGTPHVIVTREYIETLGYFIPPIFLHWFIDSWTVAIAKANSCFTHLRDYKLIHDKPSDKGLPDETHSRIREWGWAQRDTFVNETCQHFLAVEKERLRCAINNGERKQCVFG